MNKKIFLVAGARPNFMKIAPVYREMEKRGIFDVRIVHTGQHYDLNMSDIFFKDLEMPMPHISLEVGSGSHAVQTAAVMIAFEKACLREAPDLAVVVGDVNSTMACAITASKLCVPVAHVEAGLRSGDRTMPEEINRLVTDCIADILLTPSADADENLKREGIPAGKIHSVGNVMIDSLKFIMPKIQLSEIRAEYGLAAGGYGLVTLHRPANVDDPDQLAGIMRVLTATSEQVPLVFPMHPRTRKRLESTGLLTTASAKQNLLIIDPLGYRDFMNLVVNARFVLTDSGGLQEETTYLGVPCITLRPNTERPVTIITGTNELASLETVEGLIVRVLSDRWKTGNIPALWDGEASQRIADVLSLSLSRKSEVHP